MTRQNGTKDRSRLWRGLRSRVFLRRTVTTNLNANRDANVLIGTLGVDLIKGKRGADVIDGAAGAD